MKKRWFVREGIFEKNNGLWWLNRDTNGNDRVSATPMEIALRNGGISGIINFRLNGLSSPFGEKQKPF